MNQPPQTGKRIVSKSEYVRAKFSAILLSIGVLACGMGVGFLAITIRFLWGFENANDSPADYAYGFRYFWGSITLFLPLIVTTYLLGRKGHKRWTAVIQMQPLPRINIADLPIYDSLVRASAEPLQEQEAVLLRAGAQGGERHEEQLLKPAEWSASSS